jgi:hypothetical protein
MAHLTLMYDTLREPLELERNPIKLVTLALDEVTAIEIYRTAIKLAELLLEQLRSPADPVPPVASPESI